MPSNQTTIPHRFDHPELRPVRQRIIRITPQKPDIDNQLVGRITQRPPAELSITTLKVVNLLIEGDLGRLRSECIADELGVSPTTLRRRLRADHISYQVLLDQVRQYRCECQLEERWVPGKTLAWNLGYAEVNSFYRAFKRWTGANYSEMKLQFV